MKITLYKVTSLPQEKVIINYSDKKNTLNKEIRFSKMAEEEKELIRAFVNVVPNEEITVPSILAELNVHIYVKTFTPVFEATILTTVPEEMKDLFREVQMLLGDLISERYLVTN